MKEIIIYMLAAFGALFILGYSVHMFIGGLVTPVTEWRIIIATCLVGTGVIAYMGWDVVRRRRGHKR